MGAEPVSITKREASKVWKGKPDTAKVVKAMLADGWLIVKEGKYYRVLPLSGFTQEDSWPLRLAAVEAGKWGRGRPGRRFHSDACELVQEDGGGDHRQELSIVA
jgi:hypothetical protein